MNTNTRFPGGIARWLGLLVLLAILTASFSSAEAKSAKTVKVPATARWVNTKISLATGQVVSIQAKGTASTLKKSPKSSSGPNGQKNTRCGTNPPSSPPNCAMNYAPYGALVGKIGLGAPFLVGKKLTFTAKQNGLLYLAVNDNLPWYGDNAAGYDVTIGVK